jgi:hypothetical protein
MHAAPFAGYQVRSHRFSPGALDSLVVAHTGESAGMAGIHSDSGEELAAAETLAVRLTSVAQTTGVVMQSAQTYGRTEFARNDMAAAIK